MKEDVIRNFGVDYIYFDLVFLTVYLTCLVKYKKKLAIYAFFVFGIAIMLIDWGWWIHVNKIRTIILPENSFFSFIQNFKIRQFMFMYWFSQSYGIMFSWVFIMFEKNSRKVFWTCLLFGGWLVNALGSQLISIDDSVITTIRAMGSIRVYQISLSVLGYVLLAVYLKFNWKRLAQLFMIGCGIHFFMEFSLLVSGIRPGWDIHAWGLLVENCLIEFHNGIPILFFVYDKWLKKKFHHL